MPTVAEVQAKVVKTETDMDRIDLFVNGTVNDVVQTDNGPVRSIAGIGAAAQAQVTSSFVVSVPGATVTASSLTALKGIAAPPSVQSVMMLGRATGGDGGQGVFVWVTGDQSAHVTADPQNGVWVPPNSDTSGASGAWRRAMGPCRFVFAPWFGVVTGNANARAVNDTALRSALDAYKRVELDYGDAYISQTLQIDDDQVLVGQGKSDEYHTDAAFRQTISSALVIVSDTLDCVLLGKPASFSQPGAPPTGWTQAATLRDLDVRRSVPIAPANANDETNGPAGVRTRWCKHATLKNVFSYNHGIGFYWGATVYCIDQENLCAYRDTPGSNGNDFWVGCFVDGAFALGSTYAGGNASLKVKSIKCGISFGPALRSNNFLVTGGFADTWLYNPESYGVPKRACVVIGCAASNPAADETAGQQQGDTKIRRQGDGDCHFIEAAFDGAGEITLEIYYLTAYAQIDFVDPYIAVTGSSSQAGVSVHDGSGSVTFHGGEIIGWPNAHNGGSGYGLTASGDTAVQMFGTKLKGCIRPILLQGTVHHRILPEIDSPNELYYNGSAWVPNPYPAIDLVSGGSRCVIDPIIKASTDPSTPSGYKAFLTGVRTDAGSIRNVIRAGGIDETIMTSGAQAIVNGVNITANGTPNHNVVTEISA